MSSVTSSFLKFMGGVALGTVVGVGIYLVATSDSEEGLIHDIKETIHYALEEGRRAAEQRRLELERELGFSLDDDPADLPPPAVPALQTSGETTLHSHTS